MSKIYSPASEEVHALALNLVRNYHAHLLHPVRVKIDIIMVNAGTNENGDPQGHALSLGGYRCLGIAKILGPKDRAMGRSDCEIQLDGDDWPDMSEEAQAALLDHELTHFSLKRDPYGNPMIDDMRRPMLKMRKHDYDFGWFTSIAKRHGKASIEVQQCLRIVDRDGQSYLPGFGIGGDLGPELNFGQQQDEEQDEEQNPEGSAVRQFVDNLQEGTSVTITAGDKSVTVEGKKKG